MSSWRRELGQIKLIAHLLYGSVLLYAGLLYVIPRSGIMSEARDTFFMVFLAFVAADLAFSHWWASNWMSLEKLEEKTRMVGDPNRKVDAALTQVRTAVIVLAAFGEACGVLGLIYYLMTGDGPRAWIFFGLTAFHYALGKRRWDAAYGFVERLGKNVR